MQRVVKTSVGIVWLLVLLIGAGQPAATHAQDDVSWLLEKINGLRASLGLPAYALNAQLSTAATWQSQYLVETCNIVHVRPDGSSPTSRAAACLARGPANRLWNTAKPARDVNVMIAEGNIINLDAQHIDENQCK